MKRIKLTYNELDNIIDELFKNIIYEFRPEIVIHPGVRTDYLINKSKEFFNITPYIVDTARDFPCKKLMRKIFYEMFDYVPDSIADYISDLYIGIVHSKSKKPKVLSHNLKLSSNKKSNILLLDDVFCTGDTLESVVKIIPSENINSLKSAVLIWSPVNGKSPDFFVLKGKYSLPWRNIGI